MKLIRLIAMSMILLVLTIPFSLAFTMVGTGFGQDEVLGFIRQTDDITLKVEFTSYDTSQGVLVYDDPLYGDRIFNCNGDVCTLELDEDTYSSEPLDFTTVLNGDETEMIRLYPDVLGASVTSVTVDENEVTSEDTLIFTIKLSDGSCSTSGCNAHCTGIKKINIYKGSSLVHEIGLYHDVCSETITESIDVSDLDPDEGLNTYVFEAVDNFDNTPRLKRSIIIDVDDTAPSLGNDDFYIQKDGVEVEYYKAPISNVDLIFYLTEISTSTRVDLSSLGMGWVIPYCTALSCHKTLDLNLGSMIDGGDYDLNIGIELIDELGNSDLYELTKSFIVDRSGPFVEEVFTNSSIFNDAVGFGTNSQLVVEMDDDGIGVDENDNVYADFSDINPSYSNVKAIDCVQGICTFQKIPIINEGYNYVKILGSSSDDLGNLMGTDYSFQVYSDKSSALVSDIIVILNETDQEYNGTSLPSIGDKMIVIATIEEFTDVFAYGDFSIISDEGLIEADCEGGSDVSGWRPTIERLSSGDGSVDSDIDTDQIVCEWEVEITNSGNILEKSITLYFEDPFGNIISEEVSIPNIYGINEEEEPNYWTSQVTCSPQYLDRAMGELVDQQMYCFVTLTPLSNEQQYIRNVELDGCDGDEGYLDDEELSNDLTSYPYITLTFDQDEYLVNELKLNCTLKLSSIVGYNIIDNEESEVVNIPVKFFNNPFGMPDDSMASEIEDIQKTWLEGFGKFIGTMKMIEGLATNVCKALSTINQAASIISGGVSKIPDNTGGTIARAKTDVAVNKPSMFSKLADNKFCKFVNCKSDWIGGKTPDWLESLSTMDGFGGEQIEQVTGSTLSEFMNTKDNVYLSMASLCIPGIINNLDKYRQIQCFYGYCLVEMTQYGIPPYGCEQQKSYLTCKYFLGPIFTFFAPVNLFNTVVNYVKEALSNPFALIGVVFNLACPPTQSAWTMCRFVHVVSVSLNTFEELSGIWTSTKSMQDDYCSAFEDSLDEIEKTGSSSTARGYA